MEYALEGSIAVGGAGITWLKNTLGALEKPEDSEQIARSVPDSAGQLISHGLLYPWT
jgi:glycerol kinase